MKCLAVGSAYLHPGAHMRANSLIEISVADIFSF